VRSSSSCRQADSGSKWLGDRVTGKEAGESVGHGGGVLRVQEMGEAGQVEWLGVGQPVQQQLLPFGEHRGAGCPQDGERWRQVTPPAIEAATPSALNSDWIGVEARDTLHATIISRDLRRFVTEDGGRTWVQQQ